MKKTIQIVSFGALLAVAACGSTTADFASNKFTFEQKDGALVGAYGTDWTKDEVQNYLVAECSSRALGSYVEQVQPTGTVTFTATCA
ncbi:hypothetical protein [Rhodovulum sp. FJ3]|uniref:hypothetical protein n=1 Tax=Rhodovulum sp. FJ3 TaxID=3079053 RepID=UPI00293DA74F|nr:hypothetical protein [Rhodovulum sp. FJ3]MDV4169022.1 hypothetical protein [Rhodovulum sp. FJ3]